MPEVVQNAVAVAQLAADVIDHEGYAICCPDDPCAEKCPPCRANQALEVLAIAEGAAEEAGWEIVDEECGESCD